MLDESQQQQLIQLVWQYLGTDPPPATVQTLISASLYGSVPTGGGYAVSKWIVLTALRRRTPEMLLRVALRTGGRSIPAIHDVMRRLTADPSLWDVEDDGLIWLLNRRPFVDRRELKTTLGQMADGAGPGALVVEGDYGEGKTTVCGFIEKYATEKETFIPVIEEWHQEAVGALELELITGELSHHLHATNPASRVEPERHAVDAAQEIALAAAARQHAPVWFIVDGVDTQGVPVHVLRFVDELVGHVQKQEAVRRGLRVILMAEELSNLDFKNLPPPDARAALVDVTHECIRDWLTAAVPGKARELYELTARTVLSKLRATSIARRSIRMRLLDRTIREAHRSLQAQV